MQVINITLHPDMDLSQRNKEEVCVMLLSRSLYAIFLSDLIQTTFFIYLYLRLCNLCTRKHYNSCSYK